MNKDLYYLAFFLVGVIGINWFLGTKVTYYFMLLVFLSVIFLRWREIDSSLKLALQHNDKD